jgi:hypothetical protein
VSLSVVLALAVAHRYSFERLLMGDLGVAFAAAAAGRLRLRLGAKALRPGLTALLPLSLVLLGLWRFFPPSEYVIGGKDPGVYMNEGIQIAQRGAIVVRDEAVSSLPPFARDLFFLLPTAITTAYGSWGLSRGPDAGGCRAVSHLFPASCDRLRRRRPHGREARGRRVGDPVLAVYFAGRRLAEPAAWVAAALDGNVVQVWFARYPGKWRCRRCSLRRCSLRHRWRSLLCACRRRAAGCCCSCVSTHIDRRRAVGVASGSRRSRAARLLQNIVCPMRPSVRVLIGPMRLRRPIVFLSRFARGGSALLRRGSCGVMALVLGARMRRSARIRTIAPTVLAFALVSAAFPRSSCASPCGGAARAYALRTFFNLMLPGLLAALLGFALLAPGLLAGADLRHGRHLFIFAPRSALWIFWMTRRFLPVILPALLLPQRQRSTAERLGPDKRCADDWRRIRPPARDAIHAGIKPITACRRGRHRKTRGTVRDARRS